MTETVNPDDTPLTDEELREWGWLVERGHLGMAQYPRVSHGVTMDLRRLFAEVRRLRAQTAQLDITRHADPRRRILCAACSREHDGGPIERPTP